MAAIENKLPGSTPQYQFTFWYFGNIVFSIVYLFAQPLSLLFLYNWYNVGSPWTIIQGIVLMAISIYSIFLTFVAADIQSYLLYVKQYIKGAAGILLVTNLMLGAYGYINWLNNINFN